MGAYTPTPSRQQTPTPSRQHTPTRTYSGNTGPGHRPVSPRLMAAGGLAAQPRSPAPAAATYAGPSSRSPGPSANRSGTSTLPTLDASVHTMWASNSNQRSSYSPGPANAGSTRTTSHSPGPNLSSTAGHDLGASARMPQDRKSASLRGMLESSSRSRGPTPPSRNATPPRR